MTVSLRIKNDKFYAVASYKENGKNKQKWIALGLPIKNNKRKAEEMANAIRRDFEVKYLSPSSDTLFVPYILNWLEEKKPLIQLSTWEGYEIYAKKHIIPYFEPLNLKLNEVKSKHISDYYNHKYVSGRADGNGGLSIASLKKHGIVLREVFNAALLADLIIRNPAEGVKLPAKNIAKVEPVFLNVEEANKVLQAFEGHVLQAVVYITLYYGLRRSEILGLKWKAIDFEKGTMKINHTVVKNRTIVRKDSTKSVSSTHTYQLIDDVRDALLAQRDRQNKNREIMGKNYIESDYVFTWENGQLFRPDYVTRGFQRVLKRHGLPNMRFHDLRHSTASVLYDMGWRTKDSQSWMRHSSSKITLDTYTHIAESRRAKMAHTLNSTFSLPEAKRE